MFLFPKILFNVIYREVKGMTRRVTFAKTELVVIYYTFGDEKTVESSINYFLKYFSKDRKCRYWSVIF